MKCNVSLHFIWFDGFLEKLYGSLSINSSNTITIYSLSILATSAKHIQSPFGSHGIQTKLWDSSTTKFSVQSAKAL